VSEAVGSIGATLDLTGVTPVLEVVYPRGPAAAAGLLVGDSITALDGTPLTGLTASNVDSLISNRDVVSTIRVTVARAGKPITVSVRIASSKDGSDGPP
jgi:S1-C subfamily serine protease